MGTHRHAIRDGGWRDRVSSAAYPRAAGPEGGPRHWLTCAFVRARENVLSSARPAWTATRASRSGVKAVRNGFSTTHFVLDDLMHQLKSAAAIRPRLKAERYLNSALLNQRRGRLPTAGPTRGEPLLPPCERPLREGSIIVTSIKHVRDWSEVFAGDKILTIAILVRVAAPDGLSS